MVASGEPSRPGWDGYVNLEMQNHLGSAVWNGEEMVLVSFDDVDGTFRNMVAAYDPAIGAWRTLPDLPTDIPVTVNGLVASRHGVVVEGLGCDPGLSQDDGDGLRCVPGDVRTFLLPPGEDAFIEIDAPVRSEDEFGPVWFAEGTGAGDPHLVMDGSVYRLTDGTGWNLVDGLDASSSLCAVGGEFFGMVSGDEQGEGLPPFERLAQFDDDTKQWVEVELPVQGSYGTLHCGDGRSAWFEIMNEEPAAKATYLVTADAPPVEVDVAADVLVSSVTFAGDVFLADVTRVVPGELPSNATHQLHMLDESSAELVPSDLPPGNDSVEVRALDGKVGLFLTQSWGSNGEPTSNYEVRDLPRPAS